MLLSSYSFHCMSLDPARRLLIETVCPLLGYKLKHLDFEQPNDTRSICLGKIGST